MSDFLYLVSGVSPAPSNPNFGYIHVEGTDERFFVSADRLAKERVVEDPRLLERGELLEWKEEAAKLFREFNSRKAQAFVTNVYPNKSDDRYLTVWLAGENKPISIHQDVLKKIEYAGLGLARGVSISDELLKKAAYDSSIFYKDPSDKTGKYGEAEWAKENYRIDRTELLIRSWFPSDALTFTRIGKGAGELEFYDKSTAEGNKEIGLPDFLVTSKATGKSVMIESTGSDIMGKSDAFHLRDDTKEKRPGTDKNLFGECWVRPDKIGYMKRHPTTAVYLAFHYAGDTLKTVPGPDGKPKVLAPENTFRESICFVKPDITKDYLAYDWSNKAKGMSERFVAFFPKDPEFQTAEQFKLNLSHDLGVAPKQAIRVRAGLER